jgi:uncharacterized protein
MRALALCGGWEGHKPDVFADWLVALLEREGASVTVARSLDVLTDASTMERTDLIVPLWSSMGSRHDRSLGDMTRRQESALLEAVRRGTGIAGWHGHMADAFRDHPSYHFMIGGQFVGHPPGWPDNPVPSDDFIDYRVMICETDDPIVTGLEAFDVHAEQYYLLVDPSNKVLATTTFTGEFLPWIEGTVMPVVGTRQWGDGRVFYCSLGHGVDELELPPVKTMVRRGLLWAGRHGEGAD